MKIRFVELKMQDIYILYTCLSQITAEYLYTSIGNVFTFIVTIFLIKGMPEDSHVVAQLCVF